MVSSVYSGAIEGLKAKLIEIEADISSGFKRFDLVGLPDKAVEESKERIKSAIKSSGLKPPCSRAEKILINLAPADLKKEGALYDLPIAISYLLASKQITTDNLQKRLILGELSLNGKLRPIKGALSFSLLGEKHGFEEIILPRENAAEASLISLLQKSNIKIIGADNLKEVVEHLEDGSSILPFKEKLSFKKPSYDFDIGWIKGQHFAKRALEIAAAGGHNLLMIGPPGGGKTLLARAMPTILPELSPQEILEVTNIYSIAGLLNSKYPIVLQRPFRSPHHTASKVAIVGGGNPIKPGEITLAHRGVLFLDEFPEFHRDVIESLRQPLEEGSISLLRAKQKVTFPCRFILVAASNPCPCGHLNNPFKECVCSPSQIAKYRRKLSGPIIDRIDLFVELPYVPFEDLISPEKENLSEEIRQKVVFARKIQAQRFKKGNILTNSEMGLSQIKKYCSLEESGLEVLKESVRKGTLSPRGFYRVLKVARTIADLEGSEKIKTSYLQEALMYRTNYLV